VEGLLAIGIEQLDITLSAGATGREVRVAAVDVNAQFPIRVHHADVAVVAVATEIDVRPITFDGDGGLAGFILDLGLTGRAGHGSSPLGSWAGSIENRAQGKHPAVVRSMTIALLVKIGTWG
jgi:hypothetical protein